MAGALDGVRVLEASSGVAGPYLCQLLAEQGAEVVKLEPAQGDPFRAQPGFHAINRSRDSLLLDITGPAERPRLLDLLRRADLFVHDLSPARRKALRLERSTLAAEARNPGLIVGWLPPFGSAGPHTERPADDALVQAVEAISATQGSSDGLPVYVTPPLSSYGTAIYGAGALTAALLARGADREGQEVEVSWVAGALALQTGSAVLGQGVTRLAAARSNPLGSLPVYRCFRAADGRYLFLACGHSGFFHRFCLLIDHPELISDPRFDGAPWGLVDADARAALAAILEPIFLEKPRDEWLRLLEEADLPCAPVASRDDYLTDPQVLHNGMRLEIDDPELGPTVQASVPLLLPRSPGGVRGPAPLLGNIAGVPWRDEGPARTQPSSAAPPLQGVRVLDLSGFIAGALCPMLLGDWGADVIKVEGPDGDPFRAFGYGFLGWNRSKRGLCLDLKRPEGQALLHDLVRDADVVMENYRPGVAERLGADYATLSAINPRLVYCSGNGYGSSGPYIRKAGFDPLMQSRSGAMAAQGGMASGHPPVFLTVAISDYGAALLCAYGIVAALYERERSGRGQHVQTALINSVMAMQQVEFLRSPRGTTEIEGGPDFRGPSALVRLYGCDGGWLMLAVRDEAGWRSLLRALDRADLAELYPPAQALAEPNDGPLAALLAEAFAAETRDTWLARLDRAGVPVAPVTTGADLFTAPHLLANKLLATHQHPLWGEVVQSGDLAKFSQTRAHVERVAPLLGQHSLDVLREARIDNERVAALIAAGVVVQDTSPNPRPLP
jgi:crotonobetainyl-CoA:carnitine CoA-transferase CaiB-like acyl-CoA transferase